MEWITQEEINKVCENVGNGIDSLVKNEPINLKCADLFCNSKNCNNSNCCMSSCTNPNYGNLSRINLYCSNLTGSDFKVASLTNIILIGAKEFLDTIKWLDDNLEKTEEGYIAYSIFDYQKVPIWWRKIEGSIIEREVNLDKKVIYGSGINLSTLNYVKNHVNIDSAIYKVLIKKDWLNKVVIPYINSEKFRCGKVMMLKRIDE